MWEIKCSFLAGHLRVIKTNLWLFVNLQVSWIFGLLTSVRPRCTETRTTAWGWIWPAEGCSQQPAREVKQHGEVHLTPAYVCLGSGFSGKLTPWTCKQHNWKGIKSSGNIHRQTLESAWQSISFVPFSPSTLQRAILQDFLTTSEICVSCTIPPHSIC